jgi:hypothetical protein
MITKKIKRKSYNHLLNNNNNNFNDIYNNDSLHINSQINTQKPTILNNTKKSKKISNPDDTQSGSEVFIVKGKKDKFKNKNFIIKKTFIEKNNFFTKNKTQNECILYKYIRNLVKYNICPFIYYGFQCKTKNNLYTNHDVQFLILNTNQKNTYLKTIHNMINPLLSYNNDNNLEDFYIILFQIIYTLKCFDLIGLKHNDLHFGNIFLEINKNNKKINNSIKEQNKFTKYIIDGKSYDIPNINYTVKIYDFDYGSKNNRDKLNTQNNKEFKPNFKDNKVKEFNPLDFKNKYSTTFLNNEDSVNFDLLKVLFELYKRTLKLKNKTIKDFIETFFNNENPFDNIKQPENENIVLDSTIHNIDLYGNFKDANFSNIKPIDDILDIIYKKIKEIENNNKFKTNKLFNKKIYNTSNLYK